jgi:hypothetical protein
MAIIADGLENPDWSGVARILNLAIALIRQLARTGAGEGGGDQAGRLSGAPAVPAGAHLRSTTSSSAPRVGPTSIWTSWSPCVPCHARPTPPTCEAGW